MLCKGCKNANKRIENLDHVYFLEPFNKNKNMKIQRCDENKISYNVNNEYTYKSNKTYQFIVKSTHK